MCVHIIGTGCSQDKTLPQLYIFSWPPESPGVPAVAPPPSPLHTTLLAWTSLCQEGGSQSGSPPRLDATDAPADRHPSSVLRFDLTFSHDFTFWIRCFLQVLATWFLRSDIVCAHETWKILSPNFGMTPAIVRVLVWRECCHFSVAD
jgi:hypothetical protein